MPRFSFLPFAVLVASGCGGGDLCQKWADEFDSCEGDDFSVDECEAQIEACDANDRKLLDDFYGCASDEGLFECDSESTATNMTDAFEMLGAMLACAEPLDDLSEECQGGMMTSSTSSTSLVF